MDGDDMLGLRNGRGTYLVQRAALDLVGDLATKTGSFTYRHCRCGSAVRKCLSFWGAGSKCVFISLFKLSSPKHL